MEYSILTHVQLDKVFYCGLCSSKHFSEDEIRYHLQYVHAIDPSIITAELGPKPKKCEKK